MERFGDARKPLLATEITWPSSEGKAPPQFGVSTTEAQQAKRLGRPAPAGLRNVTKRGANPDACAISVLEMLIVARADSGWPFVTFCGPGAYVAGAITAKPALAVFRCWALTVERCRSKAASALACA